MTAYQPDDVRQSCQLIADALRGAATQLDAEQPDWAVIRQQLQRIEDRAAEGQQIAAQLRGKGH